MPEYNHYTLRTIKLLKFFLVLVLVVITILLFIYFPKSTLNTEHKRNNISRYPYPEPEHKIRKFSFDSVFGGRKILSIEADLFSINKKKLGFLRFGLMDVAMFKNANVQIFGSSKKTDTHEKQQNRFKSLIFNDIFSKDTLPAFLTKRIFSVRMEPVCIKFYDDNVIITEISSNSATIRLKKQDILFKGHVRVVSESKSLTTSQLRLLPEKAIIEINQHYILKTIEEQIEGHKLTTDIFLNSMEQQN